jgi:hypothetical protein
LLTNILVSPQEPRRDNFSFKILNFKNHPSIATELVKYLAINTSFEAIKKLTMEIIDFKKQLGASVKAAALAANKRPMKPRSKAILSPSV